MKFHDLHLQKVIFGWFDAKHKFAARFQLRIVLIFSQEKVVCAAIYGVPENPE